MANGIKFLPGNRCCNSECPEIGVIRWFICDSDRFLPQTAKLNAFFAWPPGIDLPTDFVCEGSPAVGVSGDATCTIVWQPYDFDDLVPTDAFTCGAAWASEITVTSPERTVIFRKTGTNPNDGSDWVISGASCVLLSVYRIFPTSAVDIKVDVTIENFASKVYDCSPLNGTFTLVRPTTNIGCGFQRQIPFNNGANFMIINVLHGTLCAKRWIQLILSGIEATLWEETDYWSKEFYLLAAGQDGFCRDDELTVSISDYYV